MLTQGFTILIPRVSSLYCHLVARPVKRHSLSTRYMLTLELLEGMETMSRSSTGHVCFSPRKPGMLICNYAECWEGGSSVLCSVWGRGLTKTGRLLMFLLSSVCVCSVMFNSLRPHEFPDKNIRVGCYFLLQGIFLTQGSNLYLLHLLHWQADSLPLCHLGRLLLSYDEKLIENWRWINVDLLVDWT